MGIGIPAWPSVMFCFSMVCEKGVFSNWVCD
jgi:hypothetical protein